MAPGRVALGVQLQLDDGNPLLHHDVRGDGAADQVLVVLERLHQRGQAGLVLQQQADLAEVRQPPARSHEQAQCRAAGLLR
ncbi:hypothetical protein D3C78_1616660 [compost metagenome]